MKRKRIKVKVVPKLDPMEVIKQGMWEVMSLDRVPKKTESTNYDTAEGQQEK